jgi:hypothetical protein
LLVIGAVVAWTVVVLLAVAMLRMAALSDAEEDACLASGTGGPGSGAAGLERDGRRIALELSETERALLEAAG